MSGVKNIETRVVLVQVEFDQQVEKKQHTCMHAFNPVLAFQTIPNHIP